MLSVKPGGIKYHFWVFGMTQPGIETRSSGPLVDTLNTVFRLFLKIKCNNKNDDCDKSQGIFVLVILNLKFRKLKNAKILR